MRRRVAIAVLVSAAMATSLAACGGGGGSGSLPSRAPGGLAAAISFLPTGPAASYTFQFADWAAIEQALGLGAGSPTTQQVLGLLGARLQRFGFPPSGEALAEATKIFPAGQVAWDASVASLSGPPVNLVGFRPGFSLSSVEQRLHGCGFTARTQAGVTVYSAPIGTVLRCAGPQGANVPGTATTYAIDTAEHLVVTSGSPDAVSAALANRASHSSSPALQALLGGLLPASAIGVGVGPKLCSELSQPRFLAGRTAGPRAVAQAAHLYLPAAAYQGFGFSYVYTGTTVSGRIAFTYADGQTATNDLPAREHTLRTASSLLTSTPYTRDVTVRSGQVSGRTAVLQVGPGTGGALQLGAMLSQFDLGFARCG